MSFWGSVILPGLALGAIDRKYVDYKFRLMPINYEMTKFSRLNERVYFLPGGNQAINDAMFKCFKTNLGEKPFPLVQLNLIEKRFKEEIGNLWAEKKEVIAVSSRIGPRRPVKKLLIITIMLVKLYAG